MYKWIAMCLAVMFLCASCASMPRTTHDRSFQKRYGGFDYCPLEPVLQVSATDCGIACVSSVCSYWGEDTDEQHLFAQYPQLEGKRCSLKQLQEIAAGEGLQAFIVSFESDPLPKLREQLLKGRPVICPVTMPRMWHAGRRIPVCGTICRSVVARVGPTKLHFVVVFGIQDDQLLVMDPAHGIATIPWRSFDGFWGRMQYAALLCSSGE